MEIDLHFFDFKKNCKEYIILVKATSRDATRSEVLKGQELFDSIYKRISALEKLLDNVNSAITRRDVTIKRGDEQIDSNEHRLQIKYPPEIDFNISYRYDMDYYYGHVLPHIQEINHYLKFDFDHNLHVHMRNKRNVEIEEKIKKGSASVLEKLVFDRKPLQIKDCIEVFLQHYSDLSYRFMKFIDVFLIVKKESYRI